MSPEEMAMDSFGKGLERSVLHTLAWVLGLGGRASLSMSQWIAGLRTGSAWKLGEGS